MFTKREATRITTNRKSRIAGRYAWVDTLAYCVNPSIALRISTADELQLVISVGLMYLISKLGTVVRIIKGYVGNAARYVRVDAFALDSSRISAMIAETKVKEVEYRVKENKESHFRRYQSSVLVESIHAI